MSIELAVNSGPRVSDGSWEDVDQILEGVKEGVPDDVKLKDYYDHIDNAEQLLEYITGEGEYETKRSFIPNEEDIEDQKREMRQLANPKCPNCVEEINDMLREGAMRSEIDIDPYTTSQTWTNESEANYNEDMDKHVNGHFIVYCDRHKNDSFFGYNESWFEKE